MENEVKIIKKGEKDDDRDRGFFYILFHRVKLSRLIILLIALIVTGVLLTGSTYAWFTSNYTVTVQKIDVNVSSGSGIQISTNATDWKSIITIEDILENKYNGAVNQVPQGTAQMNPVSTINTPLAGATSKSAGLKMFRGTIVNDTTNGTMYLNSSQDTDGANTDYIAFDLFVKLDYANAQQVYLTGGTGITCQEGTTCTNIEYAGRMGFVINGNTASSQTVQTMIDLNGGASSVVKIYEPNYDVHTANGLANGRDNYNITGYNLTGNTNAVPYYGLKSEFAYVDGDATTGVPLDSTDSNKFGSVTVNLKTTKNNSSPIEFAELSPGVTKIRVYMWIEGQDIDCENTASGGSVSFNLGFTLDND